jgi:hypothetical protein
MNYLERNASKMITKSRLASPVSLLINSARSSSVARSFLRNNGKRAGFLPAPFRLPPWVAVFCLRMARRLALKKAIESPVNSGLFINWILSACGASLAQAPIIISLRSVNRAPALSANISHVHIVKGRCWIFALIAERHPFIFHALRAIKTAFDMRAVYRTNISIHWIIPFLFGMNTVYRNLDRMSRVNTKLVSVVMPL